MDELIFEPAESSIEAVGRATKPNLRGSIRSEPLGFPFLGLVLFMIVYFARPED